MLVECGFVRAQTDDGAEFTFSPSIGRIATLGNPREIVELFVELHGPDPSRAAAYVLYCLCDQEDPAKLVGWHGESGFFKGMMPVSEQVIIARHLMIHGIAGKAKPTASKTAGKYSDEFNAAEYIAAACVHLGISTADAEALSMTEFQQRFEMKFPDQNKKKDLPTRDEYAATMASVKGRRNVD